MASYYEEFGPQPLTEFTEYEPKDPRKIADEVIRKYSETLRKLADDNIGDGE